MASNLVIKIDGDTTELKKSIQNTNKDVEKSAKSMAQTLIAEYEKAGKSQKSMAAALASEYKKAGMTQSDAFKKAWDDVKKYSKDGTNDSIKNIDRLKSSLSTIGNIAKTGLKVLATATATAGTALAGAGVYAVNLASNLSEVQNVVDVTFGDNAQIINNWAKNAASSFGLSELQAKKFNGTMGAMLKSMGLTDSEVLNMSTSMTGLAADFASFYNLEHEEAFEKIRSGISGETEPLKELGINMSVANLEAYALSQGITTAYNSMTQAEQATLRYNYLMSVSADAQGDFARTSDSLANQLRVAKLQIDDIAASVGSVLLPIATQGITELNGLVQQLKAAFEEGGIQGLVAEAGNVVGAFAQKIVELAPTLISSALTLVQSLAQLAPTLISSALTLVQSLAQGIFDNLTIIISTVLHLLNTFIQNNLEPIIDAALTLIMALADGIVEALPILVDAIPTLIDTLVMAITNPQMLQKIMETGIELVIVLAGAILDNLFKLKTVGIQLIITMIKAVVNQMYASVSTILSSIQNYIIQPFQNMSLTQIGRNLIEGLYNGISSKYYWLKSKVTGVIDNIKGWFTGIFGFDTHSPSKWSEKVFKNVMEGMNVGAEKNKKYAKNAALTAVNTAKDTFEKNSILDNIKIGARNVSAMLGVPQYAFGVSGGGTVNNYTTYTDRAPIQVTSVAVLDGEVVYQNQQTVSANHGEKLSNRGW